MEQISWLIFFLVTLFTCGAQDVVTQPSETESGTLDFETDDEVPWPLGTNEHKSNNTVMIVPPPESNSTIYTHDEQATDVQENLNTTTVESPSPSAGQTKDPVVTTESSTSDPKTDPGEETTTATPTPNISSTPTPTSPQENVTTTQKEIVSTSEEPFVPIEEGGLATWGVVVVALLISFAIILTALSFLRRYLIRRRREDQRKLLRNSASAEGFFYGDGSGSNSARFHDSI